MEKVRVEGLWVGVIEIVLATWTVEMLRAEVANRSGRDPHSLSLVSSGGILLDGYSLRQLGIKNNSKILSNSMNFEPNNGEQHFFFEDMWRKFAKISEVLERTERESDGQPGNDDRNDQQEDQSEKKFDLGSRADQKAAFLGLTIHWEAKLLISMEMYNGALELLNIAERTFLLCNQKNLEMLDNVVLLNIETVWCHFMLRDIPAITAAGDRLKKAKEGLEVALERDFSRIARFLRGVSLPEIALTMKLELLEGVVAYHNDRLSDARIALESAQEKHLQLDVSEDSLSFLLGMGFTQRDAITAIRMNDNKVFKALEFLEAKKSEPKRERDCSKSAVKKMKSVKIGRLKDLVSIGLTFQSMGSMERSANTTILMNNKAIELKPYISRSPPKRTPCLFTQRDAITAIRMNDNKVFKALEFLEAKKSEPKRERDCSKSAVKKMKSVKIGRLKDLVSIGFDMFLAVEALRKNNDDKVNAFIDLSNPPTSALLEGQLRGNKRQRTLAVAPVCAPGGTSFEVQWASDSSSDDSSDDSEDEEERVDLVQDLVNVTAPTNYDIEYYDVGDGIDEYLDRVPKQVSTPEANN